MVAFVDDDGVELPWQSRQPVRPRQRLHAADHHRRVHVVALGRDEPDAERECRVRDRDLLRCLTQQFVAVSQHERASTAPGDQ